MDLFFLLKLRSFEIIFSRRGSEGSNGASNKIKFRVGFKDTKCDISYGSKVDPFEVFSFF